MLTDNYSITIIPLFSLPKKRFQPISISNKIFLFASVGLQRIFLYNDFLLQDNIEHYFTVSNRFLTIHLSQIVYNMSHLLYFTYS